MGSASTEDVAYIEEDRKVDLSHLLEVFWLDATGVTYDADRSDPFMT